MIGAILRPYLLPVAAAASLALGATVLWQRMELADGRTALANERAAHQTTRADHARVLSDLNVKTAAAARAAMAFQAVWQGMVGKLETDYQRKLQNAQTNNSTLGAGGTRSVYIRATCPAAPAAGATPADVPGIPAAQPPITQAVELAPELRQSFWATRGTIAEEAVTLEALQRYAVACHQFTLGKTGEDPKE